MNELIAKLYNQAIILEGNGDYVAGELDPVKFAELIILECANVIAEHYDPSEPWITPDTLIYHFGVEE
jgi:hypothetical protein